MLGDFPRCRLETKDKVAGIVGFRFGPFRQKRLHALANWIFMRAAAISPD